MTLVYKKGPYAVFEIDGRYYPVMLDDDQGLCYALRTLPDGSEWSDEFTKDGVLRVARSYKTIADARSIIYRHKQN